MGDFHNSLQVDRADKFCLPPILVWREQTLMINVELDSDNLIPFNVFDELSSKHGLDMTAMSWPRTHFGGLYRAYVLMQANRA